MSDSDVVSTWTDSQGITHQRTRYEERIRQAKARVQVNDGLHKDIERTLHEHPAWSRRRARRQVERELRKRKQVKV